MPLHASGPGARHDGATRGFRRSVMRLAVGLAVTSLVLSAPGAILAAGFRPGSTLAGTSTVRNLPFGHKYQFRVSAVDTVGNVGAWATGPIVAPYLVQQTSSTAYTGTWLTQSASAYSGGSVRHASALGASATFTSTFTRSIGFVTTKAASRGSFRVYIDGVLKATVSAYSATTAYRQVVYQFTFPVRGTHTMKIYVLGTAGHPRVDIDAFLVLK